MCVASMKENGHDRPQYRCDQRPVGEYLMQTVEDPNLDAKWEGYVKAG